MKNFYATSKKFSWPYPSGHRLLHSPSLVAVGLSVGWHHSFVIGWSKDRLGLPSAPLHYGLKWPVGIPTVFQTPVSDSPFALQLPTVRAVQRGLWKSLQWSAMGGCYTIHSTDYMQSFSLRCLSPHNFIKQRKCQHTIIETVLLARNDKIKQSNETLSQFCTLHNHGPTHW